MNTQFIHTQAVKPRNWIVPIVFLFLLLALTGCPVVHIPFAYGTLQLDTKDFDAIRNGNLLDVRDRFEKRKKDLNDLNIKEHALLCDIYVRHMSINKALECLEELERHPDSEDYAESIQGKQGLIHYMLGNYDSAAKQTEDLESDGGRYIDALSRIQLGNSEVAVDRAHQWALSYEPPRVFLAASLFLATERYEKVLETLQEPERRLDRDYGLSGSSDIFGLRIDPAPLRIDMFGEFGFGLLDTFSYAPQGNVYVEYALAKAELETGKIDKARQRYDIILEKFPGIVAYRDIYWRALYDRGRIAEIDGENPVAVDCYKKSIEVIERARQSITTDAGRIGFVGDKQNVYQSLTRLLLAEGDVVSAFEYSERARARALIDLLATVHKFGARSAPNVDENQLIMNYERTENGVSDAQVSTLPKKEFEKRMREATNTDMESWASVSPEVAVLVRAKPPEFAKIASSLQEDEALLSYDFNGNQWGLYLVRKGKDPRYIPLPSVSDLNSDVKKFRASLLEKDSDYQTLARQLYDALIMPAQDKKHPGTKLPKKLTIVPFRTLHYLPFAALLSPTGEFLVEQYTLAVVPSADSLQFFTPKDHQRASGVLAVGNPKRDDQLPLQHAESEAIYAAKRGKPRIPPLLGPNATKKNFLRLAQDKKIVHVASHGVFNLKDPLRSGLLLAPNPSEGNLTVVDLLQVAPRWNATLTVLSACQSSVGKLQAGGDIIGLQRGLLYAGTTSIVGTLWQISDDAPEFLMKRFYAYLDRGHTGAEALRLAQIDTKNDPRYHHPKEWAAFVYTGLHL